MGPGDRSRSRPQANDHNGCRRRAARLQRVTLTVRIALGCYHGTASRCGKRKSINPLVSIAHKPQFGKCEHTPPAEMSCTFAAFYVGMGGCSLTGCRQLVAKGSEDRIDIGGLKVAVLVIAKNAPHAFAIGQQNIDRAGEIKRKSLVALQ
jgi:hypothetical protein